MVTTEEVDAIVSENPEFYHGLSTFNFNIFEFSCMIGRKMQMPVIAMALIKTNGLNELIDRDKYL